MILPLTPLSLTTVESNIRGDVGLGSAGAIIQLY